MMPRTLLAATATAMLAASAADAQPMVRQDAIRTVPVPALLPTEGMSRRGTRRSGTTCSSRASRRKRRYAR